MRKRVGEFVRGTLHWPSGHKVVTAMASLYSIYSRGKWTPIYQLDDLWIHECPEGSIVDRYINFTATPAHYRALTMDYWCQFYKPQPGDCIIDIGAGIGTESAYFAQAVGQEGQVFAIEAHPATYKALDLFCQLNHLTNVTKLHLAIHDSEEDVWIDNPTSHVHSSIVGNNQGLRVKGTTLDQISRTYGLAQIDFIKMNIEGAENFALQGMVEVLQKTRYICVACHDFMADSTGNAALHTKQAVEDFLSTQGFQILHRDHDSRPWIRAQVNAVKL